MFPPSKKQSHLHSESDFVFNLKGVRIGLLFLISLSSLRITYLFVKSRTLGCLLCRFCRIARALGFGEHLALRFGNAEHVLAHHRNIACDTFHHHTNGIHRFNQLAQRFLNVAPMDSFITEQGRLSHGIGLVVDKQIINDRYTVKALISWWHNIQGIQRNEAISNLCGRFFCPIKSFSILHSSYFSNIITHLCSIVNICVHCLRKKQL